MKNWSLQFRIEMMLMQMIPGGSQPPLERWRGQLQRDPWLGNLTIRLQLTQNRNRLA
jgi:hypothetical protein